MANHKSSEKRIRQTVAKRAHNRLVHKTARNAVKALRNTTDKSAAEALLPKVTSMLDKLAKGDEIITSGGIAGTVAAIGESFVTVEVANGVQLRVQRAAIANVLPKGTLKSV